MSDKIPTPRTDEHVSQYSMNGHTVVLADFARQLERELTACRASQEMQSRNYYDLLEAVVGGDCVTSDFKDVIAIARANCAAADKLMKVEQEKGEF